MNSDSIDTNENRMGDVYSGCRFSALGNAGLHIVFGLLGLAGLLKFMDLPAFQETMSTWSQVPEILRSLLVVLVPAVELLLAIAWFGGMVGRLQCVLCAITILSIYTAAILVQLFQGSPPNCGCFGLLQEWFEGRRGAQLGVVRNLFMIAIVLVSWSLSKASNPTMRERIESS